MMRLNERTNYDVQVTFQDLFLSNLGLINYSQQEVTGIIRNYTTVQVRSAKDLESLVQLHIVTSSKVNKTAFEK